MTATQVWNNPTEAPADAAAFFRLYYPYIRKFVAKYGYIRSQDVDDVASAIFERLLVTDVIHQFDPEHVIIHNGKQYPARFEMFLAKKLSLYLRYHRDVQAKRAYREVYLDAESDAEGLFDFLAGGTEVDMFAGLEEAELVERLTNYLRRIPPRAPVDALDLPRLFACVVAQVRLFGKVEVAGLSATMGVTKSCVSQWLRILRDHLRDCLSGKEPPLQQPLQQVIVKRDDIVMFGGMPTTISQLEEAQAELRADSSNFIKQPLERAGSPLALCDYHGVCAEYRSAWPAFTASRPRFLERETFEAALADVIRRCRA